MNCHKNTKLFLNKYSVKDGQVTDRIVGVVPADQIRQQLEHLL